MRYLKNSRLLVRFFYLLAAVCWLLWALLGSARVLWAQSRGEYPTRTLSAEELELNSFVNYADLEWDTPPYDSPDLYLTTDGDAQLIWYGNAYLESVTLHAVHYVPPGAVVLYYLKPGQTDFSERQKVYAAVTGSGEYTFSLGGRQVSALRIDPDSRGGVPTEFHGVELNPPRPWYLRFWPNAGQWLLMMLLPAAAAAVFHLLGEIYYAGGRHEDG